MKNNDSKNQKDLFKHLYHYQYLSAAVKCKPLHFKLIFPHRRRNRIEHQIFSVHMCLLTPLKAWDCCSLGPGVFLSYPKHKATICCSFQISRHDGDQQRNTKHKQSFNFPLVVKTSLISNANLWTQPVDFMVSKFSGNI